MKILRVLLVVVLLVVGARVSSRPLNSALRDSRGSMIYRTRPSSLVGVLSSKTSGPSTRGAGHSFDQNAPLVDVP